MRKFVRKFVRQFVCWCVAVRCSPEMEFGNGQLAYAIFVVPILALLYTLLGSGLLEATTGVSASTMIGHMTELFKFTRHGFALVVKIVVGTTITFFSTRWAHRSSRKSWEKMEFLKVVQVSLNYVADEDGTGKKLRFRTLDECSVDVLMHQQKEGIQQILKAARKTTPSEPFMYFAGKSQLSDCDFHSLSLIMSAVTNRISTKFASGYVDYDMGIPVVRKKYWLGLTCEKPTASETFAIRIRIMVASDNFLRHTDWSKEVGFERASHIARWNCLRKMAQILKHDDGLRSKGEKGLIKKFWTQLILRPVIIFRSLPFPRTPQERDMKNPHVKMKQRSFVNGEEAAAIQ